MTYEGKHRRSEDGGLGIGKVAGLAGVAATTAAILSVGFGAGTASADSGLLHNLFSPKKPSTSTTGTVTTNATAAAPQFRFGQLVTKPASGDGSYFSFNGKGPAIQGLCLNRNGCNAS